MRQIQRNILLFISLFLACLFPSCKETENYKKQNIGLGFRAYQSHDFRNIDSLYNWPEHLTLDTVFSNDGNIPANLMNYLSIDSIDFQSQLSPDTAFKFGNNFFYQLKSYSGNSNKNKYCNYLIRYYSKDGKLISAHDFEVFDENVEFYLVKEVFYLIQANYRESHHTGEVNIETTEDISISQFYKFSNESFDPIEEMIEDSLLLHLNSIQPIHPKKSSDSVLNSTNKMELELAYQLKRLIHNK